MIVHKFGGTSVADARCFSQVTDIVASCKRREDTVVVVSAMSGVTDQLIAGARAAADGDNAAYRNVRANLLSRHLEVLETAPGQQRGEGRSEALGRGPSV